MERKPCTFYLHILLRKHRALLRALPATHVFVKWLFHSNSKRRVSTVRELVSLLSDPAALYEEWFSVEKIVSKAGKDQIICRDGLTNIYFCVEFSNDIKFYACEKEWDFSKVRANRVGSFVLYPIENIGSMLKDVHSYKELIDIVYERPSKSSRDRAQLYLNPRQSYWSSPIWWWDDELPPAEFRGQNALYYLHRRICNPILFTFFGGDLSLLPSAFRSDDFNGPNGCSMRRTFTSEPMVNLGECIEIDEEATLDLVNEDIDKEVLAELPQKLYDEIANNVLSNTSAHTMSDVDIEVDDIYDAEVEEYVDKHYYDAVEEKNADERLALELAEETSLLTLLSQQYLNRSPCVDITTNFKAAMFFAGSDKAFAISNNDYCYVIVFMIEGHNRYCWDTSHIARCTSVEPLRLAGQSARMIFVSDKAPNEAVNGILKILKIPRAIYIDFLNHMRCSVFDGGRWSERQRPERTEGLTSHSIRIPLPRPLRGNRAMKMKRQIDGAQASIRRVMFPSPKDDAFFEILLRKKKENSDENYNYVYEVEDNPDY